jgi:hypothetical protein
MGWIRVVALPCDGVELAAGGPVTDRSRCLPPPLLCPLPPSPLPPRASSFFTVAHEKPLSGVAWQREGVFWTLSTDGVMKKWTH